MIETKSKDRVHFHAKVWNWGMELWITCTVRWKCFFLTFNWFFFTWWFLFICMSYETWLEKVACHLYFQAFHHETGMVCSHSQSELSLPSFTSSLWSRFTIRWSLGAESANWNLSLPSRGASPFPSSDDRQFSRRSLPSESVSEWFHRIYYGTRIKSASDGADGACEAKHGASAAAASFSKWFSTDISMVLLLKRGCFRSLADILWGEQAGWSLIRSSEITGRPSACLEQRFQSATYTSCLGVHHVRAQLLWINHLSDFISPPLWCYCTLGLGSLPFFLSGLAA